MKVCTNCENGVYDYGVNKLYCHGQPKQDNTACSEWVEHKTTCSEPSNKGSISYTAWNSIKGRGHHG